MYPHLSRIPVVLDYLTIPGILSPFRYPLSTFINTFPITSVDIWQIFSMSALSYVMSVVGCQYCRLGPLLRI